MKFKPRMWAIGVALVLTCGQAASAERLRVEALQWCDISPLGVTAQTIMDVQRYDQLEKRQATSRYLIRVECEAATRSCRGMRLNVWNIESGHPVGLIDIILPINIRLSSLRESIAVVSWENRVSDITLTIDMQKRIFEYHSSGKMGEARGVGSCPPLLEPQPSPSQ